MTPIRIAGLESGRNQRPLSNARLLAHCPFCGQQHVALLMKETRKAEDALCSGRCADAWQALTALRVRESENRTLAARRRLESETGTTRAPALYELLLTRWRAGNWTVTPDDLLRTLNGSAETLPAAVRASGQV